MVIFAWKFSFYCVFQLSPLIKLISCIYHIDSK